MTSSRSFGRFRRWYLEVGAGLSVTPSDRRAARAITRSIVDRIQLGEGEADHSNPQVPAWVECRREIWDVADEDTVASLVTRLFARACRRAGIDAGRLQIGFVDGEASPQIDPGARLLSQMRRRQKLEPWAIEVRSTWGLRWVDPPRARLTCGGEAIEVAAPLLLGRDNIELLDDLTSGDGSAEWKQRISRRHAEISVWRGRWVLRDLGSTHGTLLDGRPVGPLPTPMRGGSCIDLGGALAITVSLDV